MGRCVGTSSSPITPRATGRTEAPLVIRDNVLVGVSGDFDNLRGFLRSIDPETGKTNWTWYASPEPTTPDSTTGGMTWMTGTYDPDLEPALLGHGWSGRRCWNGKTRGRGEDPYTCAIVALNPDTGELKWSFSASPHDTHDWDAVETPILIDGTVNGQPRKLLAQASRNGYFFILDRANGKNVLTTTFGPTNWAKGIDAKGQPIPNPAKEPAPDGRLIAPDESGLNNYRSSSFDPEHWGSSSSIRAPAWSLYFAKPGGWRVRSWAGADYGPWARQSWRRSITRPERSAGPMTSATAARARVS